jgi:hypothetical protein
MKGTVSRRSVLAGAGYALAGTTAGQLIAAAQAQEAAQAEIGSICLTMLFESGAKAKFESDKYVKRHLPLLKEVYGDSVGRIEVRTANAATMGIPSAFLATSTLWIRDVPSFSQKLAANAEKVNKDLDSVAKGNRLVQPDRIVLAMGDARSEISSGNVFSLFYRSAADMPGMRGMPGMPGGGRGGPGGRPPGGRSMGGPPGSGGPSGAAPAAPAADGTAPAPAADGAAATPATPAVFDSKYFTEVYLPKLYSLYGSNAVRRLEATTGVDQGAQKARQVAAYHIYVRDRGAYDGKSQSVLNEMQKDSSRFLQGFVPVFADLRLTAVA